MTNIKTFPWKDCIGEGWHPLCEQLIEDITKMGWNGEIYQVKEKFGGLRWYIGSASVAVHDRIHKAETDSYKICEDCGAEGKPRHGAWIRTLCDLHYDENEERKRKELEEYELKYGKD